jgi:hypothetical protein
VKLIILNLQLNTCVDTLKVKELEKQEEQFIEAKDNI